MSGAQQLGSVDIARMSTEEISVAAAAGQFTEYQAGKDPSPKPPGEYEVRQYGAPEMQRMSSEEITAAVRAGHFTAYLRGEAQPGAESPKAA